MFKFPYKKKTCVHCVPLPPHYLLIDHYSCFQFIFPVISCHSMPSHTYIRITIKSMANKTLSKSITLTLIRIKLIGIRDRYTDHEISSNGIKKGKNHFSMLFLYRLLYIHMCLDFFTFFSFFRLHYLLIRH